MSKLTDVKEKISKANKKNYVERGEDIIKKYKETLVRKYGTTNLCRVKRIVEKRKNTLTKLYGVDCYFKTQKSRDDSSKRMIKNNCRGTFKNNFNIKLYKDTTLYYQSKYEKHFLELCENIGILEFIENGHAYKFLKEDDNYGHRTLTDFSINDLEIEIKSGYYLSKGIDIEIKRRAVESKNKTYLLILDKNYDEFLLIFSDFLKEKI